MKTKKKLPPDKRIGLVDESRPIGHCAVEASCVHQILDEKKVPREYDLSDGPVVYSL